MYEHPDPEMGKKIEGLRRAVKFGVDNGKRNMMATTYLAHHEPFSSKDHAEL
jgi:hypothetical protein